MGTTPSALFLLSDSGAAELAVTVPDSITDWKAMTFCTSESHGLGISETTSLQSFKPFFVEPALPYSVFRGESFPLKVKVFSYLKQCMVVSGSCQDGGWAGGCVVTDRDPDEGLPHQALGERHRGSSSQSFMQSHLCPA